MTHEELDGRRLGRVPTTPADTMQKARLACADAVLRGVFPEAELADHLAALGLLPKKRGRS